MNKLRELGEFVGLGDATPMSVTGQAIRNPVTMWSVGERLSPVLSGDERTSLRAMILALPRLPPISLEVEATGNLAGEVPIWVTFTVHPSSGVILGTVLNVFQDGRSQGSPLVLSGPDFSTTSAVVSEPNPGSYVVIVSRAGRFEHGHYDVGEDLQYLRDGKAGAPATATAATTRHGTAPCRNQSKWRPLLYRRGHLDRVAADRSWI